MNPEIFRSTTTEPRRLFIFKLEKIPSCRAEMNRALQIGSWETEIHAANLQVSPLPQPETMCTHSPKYLCLSVRLQLGPGNQKNRLRDGWHEPQLVRPEQPPESPKTGPSLSPKRLLSVPPTGHQAAPPGLSTLLQPRQAGRTQIGLPKVSAAQVSPPVL